MSNNEIETTEMKSNESLKMNLDNTKKNHKQRTITNSGYSHYGANTRKKSLRGWDSSSKSPNEDINKNLSILRERNRDLYMGGASLATSAINTMRTNVVGSGLILKPSIDPTFLKMKDDEAEEWKRTVVREFDYWAGSTNCDSFRMNNFYEMQQLAFISQLLSGDAFVLMPYKNRKDCIYELTIQLIEADRIATPTNKVFDKNISQGVEIKNGEITAYYIANGYNDAYNTVSYAKVNAFGEKTGRRNILHLMVSERPEQTRGVPILAPVIEDLRQLGEYSNAELVAAVISGLFTVFIKTKTPEHMISGSVSPQDRISDDDYSLEMGHGSILQLDPDEEIDVADPGRPNANFDGFVTAVTKQIGAALEIPYELLTKHFSASYSASRAALLEAWKMFRMRRTWFANDFCQPIYEEWLTEAVSKGRIYAPGFFDDPVIRHEYCKAEWHGPSQGQIDPLKEVNAAIKRIDSGISTGEREASEMTGTDYATNHRQLLKEMQMQAELEKAYKDIMEGSG